MQQGFELEFEGHPRPWSNQENGHFKQHEHPNSLELAPKTITLLASWPLQSQVPFTCHM